MNDAVISVEKLSKRYMIGHQRDPSDALRHALENAIRRPLRWLREQRNARVAQTEEFWALKDVSFEVKQGDAVAIIGRNGAGKSTLLKILSRITEPTAGQIRLRGRVASLLEVGTGFHQELTGRENIFLNGAILGMSKQEIRSKFDEIVAFSEIENFLDTPVKRYSSGMYVRLAFAVAAHLEPEILIVDEVLAVGDASFQKKCLGRMGEVAKQGRTVLFVSHNMPAISALCKSAIYLHKGQVAAIGSVETLVGRYLSETVADGAKRLTGPLAIGSDLTLDEFSITPNPVISGQKLTITLTFGAKRNTSLLELHVLIYADQHRRVAIADFRAMGMPLPFEAGQKRRLICEIADVPFVEGDYSLGIFASISGFMGDFKDLVGLTVGARPTKGIYSPFPVEYRGVVELNYDARQGSVD
ncbi:ABC transporter ATP-binding protein [Horticoccus sp. 23ND18S-11]|uniref:ABC transporter ATP-binding protein n=1 Tax=Horticoccus sp. 23ND18S-11 TaxID=3391832 RepID=UPI0039C8F224